MKVAEIFETLDYGPAPESASTALEWLERYDRKFQHFINGEFAPSSDGEFFETVNPAKMFPGVVTFSRSGGISHQALTPGLFN